MTAHRPNLAEVDVCKNDEDSGVIGVRDPGLLSVEHPVVSVLLGTGAEGKGVRPAVGLRETVATNLEGERNET